MSGIKSEAKTLYLLKNKKTGNLIFYYSPSSQNHKALFSKYEHASEAAQTIAKDEGIGIEIISVES